MKICAVVPTFNRKALLEVCLESLVKQTKPIDEIIVVDNASIDSTENLIKEKFPFVTYLRLSENTGSAGGYSEGMKLAYQKGHDWIWLMDNDATPLPDALEILVSSKFIQDNTLSVLCCAVYNSDGSIDKGHRTLFNKKNLSKIEINSVNYEQSYFKVDLASYTGLLVSRKVISKIAFPHKELFVQWDDYDFSLRLIKTGGEILVIPSSKLIHDAATSDKVPIRQYYTIRNKIYVCKKHFGFCFAFKKLLISVFLRRIGKITICEDQKLLRVKILYFAFRDALSGKLGKYRYD